MTILGQISFGTSEPEKLVGFLAVLGLLGVAAWRGVRWLLRAQPPADPWDAQVAADIAKSDAIPLCHHCLAPHSEAADFCPECGATVGQYTNWLPYPQLFSIGHVLRIGTFGNFKRSPLTVVGFWFFGFAEYTLFAPIYWFMLLRNKLNKGQSVSPRVQSPEETSPGH
jgi:hypothetical protein